MNDDATPCAPGHFLLDGDELPFESGDTVIEAATRAGRYIPHLCWHEGYAPHGSCRVCAVKVGTRTVAACTTRASTGLEVQLADEALAAQRRAIVQMLFIEGNHFCPSCEQSGRCKLQATAYDEGIEGPHFEEFYPDRPLDASHPDLLLDFNRCILCGLCVRASAERDGKAVFALGGHGIGSHLVVNSPSGRLVDSDIDVKDAAAHICPVGVILHKRRGFDVPIGSRRFDGHAISDVADEKAADARTEARAEAQIEARAEARGREATP
jgi:[NiFe] hydrogenase diaphorase moiety small subunit